MNIIRSFAYAGRIGYLQYNAYITAVLGIDRYRYHVCLLLYTSDSYPRLSEAIMALLRK